MSLKPGNIHALLSRLILSDDLLFPWFSAVYFNLNLILMSWWLIFCLEWRFLLQGAFHTTLIRPSFGDHRPNSSNISQYPKWLLSSEHDQVVSSYLMCCAPAFFPAGKEHAFRQWTEIVVWPECWIGLVVCTGRLVDINTIGPLILDRTGFYILLLCITSLLLSFLAASQPFHSL